MTEKKKDEKTNELGDASQTSAEEAVASQDGTDALEALRLELEEAQAKAAENLDGWQRAQAEFANYKKRVVRDQEQLYSETRGRIIKRYLEIADDLERALRNRPEEGPGVEWAEGVELISRKLMAYLESEGVTQMQIEGQSFDPQLHEAIAQEESEEHASGEILEVLQPGYMLGERVLRPAVVKVAK